MVDSGGWRCDSRESSRVSEVKAESEKRKRVVVTPGEVKALQQALLDVEDGAPLHKQRIEGTPELTTRFFFCRPSLSHSVSPSP